MLTLVLLAASAISSGRVPVVHCRAPCSALRATPGTIEGCPDTASAGATPWAAQSCHNSSPEIEPPSAPARRRQSSARPGPIGEIKSTCLPGVLSRPQGLEAVSEPTSIVPGVARGAEHGARQCTVETLPKEIALAASQTRVSNS